MVRTSVMSLLNVIAAMLLVVTTTTMAFQPMKVSAKRTFKATLLAVHNLENEDAPDLAIDQSGKIQPWMLKMGEMATTAALLWSSSPLMALAEEADDYEYGAVNAPIGIAWAGGVLAILTALLPFFLKGGEEAFEEMRERDEGKFGKGDSSALDSRRRKR